MKTFSPAHIHDGNRDRRLKERYAQETNDIARTANELQRENPGMLRSEALRIAEEWFRK